MNRSLILCIAIVILTGTSHRLFAQINTETLRKSDTKPGISQLIRFNLDYLTGNSESLQIKPGYRIDYKAPDWSSFAITELRYGNQSGLNYINQAFVHGRIMTPITESGTVELFGQKQYDDFRRVTDRQVLGMNYRSSMETPTARLATALGVMLENETNTIEGRASLIRLNSYLSGNLEIDALKLSSTIYIQPAFRDFSDYRLLMESSITTMIGRSSIGFSTIIKLAYDNQPPQGVKPMDVEINSGIVATF